MTITEFLTARLDEDEAVARGCGSAPWELLAEARQVNVSAEAIRDEKWKYGRMGYVGSFEHVENARHVARHDPARVLAEVEAKRRIVAFANVVDDMAETIFQEFSSYPDDEGADLLKLLALPYADHPDYDEAWRP